MGLLSSRGVVANYHSEKVEIDVVTYTRLCTMKQDCLWRGVRVPKTAVKDFSTQRIIFEYGNTRYILQCNVQYTAQQQSQAQQVRAQQAVN